MKKIILLGYMGSGKTTIGQILSEKLDIIAVDLDKIIEDFTNLSISEIFNQKGEVYFRKLENSFFKDLVNNSQNMVLCLGGGTPCYADNYKLLNGFDTVSFYLKGSIETLYDRLVIDHSNRPLITEMDNETMKEHIAKNLFERSFYYNQATYSINIDNKSIDMIVNQIIEKLT